MKHTLTVFLLAFILMTSSNVIEAQSMEDDMAAHFMGRWSLFIDGGAGWLNVHKDQGYLDAELLWRGGSVVPVGHVYIADGKLTVTRVNESKHGDRTHWVTQRFVLEPGVDQLVGKAYVPHRNGMGQDVIPFHAMRLPDLPDAPDLSEATYGEPVELFNGKDLTGWSLINPASKSAWRAVDGVLMNDPVQPEDGSHIYYGNLRTDATFEDFNLKLDVNVPEGNNSGVYLRGIYEIQVVDSYGKPADSHHMGALYSRITPSMTAEKPGGEWQSMDITLYDHHVTVILNGKTIIDNQPVLGVTGGAMTADEFSPGPIYLQGDHGTVHYRDMVLTPIVD